MGKQIVGSLTTISSRINTIHTVVKSLKNQSLPLDKLYLFISKEPYLLDEGINKIPDKLLPYIDSGFLIVEYVPNHGPYRKFIPIMQKYKNNENTLLCYFDDDMMYPKMLVRKLYESHLKFPNCIVSPTVYKLNYNNGKLIISHDSYYKDKSFYMPNKPRMDLWLNNAWGVMFRANLINDNELFDEKKYLSLCPKKDEGWLNAILKKNKIPLVLMDTKIPKGKGKYSKPGLKWHIKKGAYRTIQNELVHNTSLSRTLKFSDKDWYDTLMGMYDYFTI